LQIGSHDYTDYVAAEGMKYSRNDLDADGSGRNVLDGLMYRHRIGSKVKWTITFNRLPESVFSQLAADMDAEYVSVTTLDPRTNARVTRTYYSSTINAGVQRYIGGKTVYDGVTFDITER
jgi:hypothetical protein